MLSFLLIIEATQSEQNILILELIIQCIARIFISFYFVDNNSDSLSNGMRMPQGISEV